MHARIFAPLVLISASIAGIPTVKASTDAVNQLAQGCYAIQSPVTGKYFKRYRNGGLLDNSLSYHAGISSLDQAEKFYFKPTTFSHFMLYDTADRYLAAHQPLQVSSGSYAGHYAEWKIDAVAEDKRGYRFSMFNMGTARNLRHSYRDGGLFFSRLHSGEQSFRFVPAAGCKPYPEAELNAARTDEPNDSHNPGDPVQGFADIHAHLTSFMFMGGKFLHGQPFNRYGITHALKDGKDSHGPKGALDIIGNLMGPGDVNARHDTQGYPDFPSWPDVNSVSHQQAYYRWLERAHKGGLRFMVAHLVENEVLCNAQKTINPASWIPTNSCNTMKSIIAQRKALQDMQDYIDAQAGGPGKGFMRIVSSAEQAREAISKGQMAIMLGIEVSELFNCGLKDDICTKEQVDQNLATYYAQGVRSLFPIHRFDNQFGGTRIEDGFINVGQKLSTRYFFRTKECKPSIEGQVMTNGFPLIGKIPVLHKILDALGLQPEYDESRRHCNRYGLTELGTYLVNRMMDRGMIIEVDHMSYDSSDAVLRIAEARHYSGVVSAHSHSQRSHNDELSDLHTRIAKLGGMMAPYNANAIELNHQLEMMLEVVAKTPYKLAVAIGTDVNGLAKQATARKGIDMNPVEYPFTSFDGRYRFDKQKTGNRTFDYNKEGLAHYGLMPDHLEDLRKTGSPQTYDALMNSAEAYLQMWERAQSAATWDKDNHVDPNAG